MKNYMLLGPHGDGAVTEDRSTMGQHHKNRLSFGIKLLAMVMVIHLFYDMNKNANIYTDKTHIDHPSARSKLRPFNINNKNNDPTLTPLE